jgi:hypothetical protein
VLNEIVDRLCENKASAHIYAAKVRILSLTNVKRVSASGVVCQDRATARSDWRARRRVSNKRMRTVPGRCTANPEMPRSTRHGQDGCTQAFAHQYVSHQSVLIHYIRVYSNVCKYTHTRECKYAQKCYTLHTSIHVLTLCQTCLVCAERLPAICCLTIFSCSHKRVAVITHS